ncbi:CRISPR system Cascade subunit CasD [Psychromicrobium silvestre]|uniref:CRISPR system Cascade subunit CasD n=1 Tax=Psychromicrobium silvestre TaxID=1645614 RepID=A0A7Y9LUD1_9MICC|nr:type I-E CRISPR-associated protein Cas5/CasD [Psychromicrobium silvestre]NYE95729.1 CRISPR system Cascade subunit CasD [Psychromicrobium silvestre]
MSSLTFVLKGPLQSWGSSSRFVTRGTEQAPTKSGVIGLLAAAKGIRRTEPLTELLKLSFGVRIDQPGRLIRDFQVAKTQDGKSMPLSYRYYLGDAVFLAGVESKDDSLLEELFKALSNPVFPLYLGRRSCPPAQPFEAKLHSETLAEVFKTVDWQASPWYQKKTATDLVDVDTLLDADPLEAGVDTFRDEPISFDPRRREYGWRSVINSTVRVRNMHYVPSPKPQRGLAIEHDPLLAF